MEAQRELYGLIQKSPTAMIALEIGGGNGLQGMILGASTQMDIPVKWQTTPVVFEEKRAVFMPSVICDRNGNVVVSLATNQIPHRSLT